MPTQFECLRCAIAVFATLTALCVEGCSPGPIDFESYELDYRDTLGLQVRGDEIVVVLEQLADGPMHRYQDVTHDVLLAHRSADSLLLILDVVGLSSEPNPTIFAQTRQNGDTLFVWYADHRRSDAADVAGKSTAVQTTPPESYLKVRHVTIEAPPGIVVEFANRFLGL